MAKKKKEVKEYIPKHRKMFEYQKELVDSSKKIICILQIQEQGSL